MDKTVFIQGAPENANRDSSNFLSYQVWMSLPKSTRDEIAQIFGIPWRPENVEVFGNQLLRDGYSAASLGAITISRLQDVLGGDWKTIDDFYKLFNALVHRVEGREEIKSHSHEVAENPTQAEEALPGGTPKAGRKGKGGKQA
jgi:hypothetical protein